jgi:hypothetical protein
MLRPDCAVSGDVLTMSGTIARRSLMRSLGEE